MSSIAVTTLALYLVILASACKENGGGGGGRNCSDFSCQGQAQAWHNSHPEDGLDGDGDGIACESLPACSQAQPHAAHGPAAVVEGQPLTVPPGKLFVVTGFAVPTSPSVQAIVRFDGAIVLTLRSGAVDATPPGLVAPGGTLVSIHTLSGGFASSVFGYLTDEAAPGF